MQKTPEEYIPEEIASEGKITVAEIIITGIIIASCLEFSPVLTLKQKGVEDFNERTKINYQKKFKRLQQV